MGGISERLVGVGSPSVGLAEMWRCCVVPLFVWLLGVTVASE